MFSNSQDLFSATNVFVGIIAVIVALCAPYIAWHLTRKSQMSDDKRRTKLNIFGAIMENRHSFHSKEAVRALNLIEVAFHDNNEIRRIWREYHGMISNESFFQSSVGIELHRQKLIELQAAMARDLGYSIDQFDVQRIYAPNWLRDWESLEYEERKARLLALRPPSQEGAGPSAALTGTRPIVGGAFYLVRYFGRSGEHGSGTLYIGNGIISGADVTGGRYSGTYTSEGGRLRAAGLLQVPAGVRLVTGFASDAPTSLPLTIDLPLDFATGNRHTVLVAEQPVEASFEMLQGL